VQTEGEERRPGQSEKQRHGMEEEANVGPDQLAAFAQQESQHERGERRRQIVGEDDPRARDRHRPAGCALPVEPALCRSSQQG
jgi:hypothetical protein